MGLATVGSCLALALAQPVLVVDVTPPGEDPDGWGLRAADRLAQGLADLGIDVAAGAAVLDPRPGFSLVHGRAQHRSGEPPAVTWTLRDGAEGFSWSGSPDDLEQAAAAAVVAVARGRGHAVPPTAKARLVGHVPPPVQRLLGRARRRELAGHPRQAALMFERAARLGDRFWYEALRDAVRARAAASPDGTAADVELAKAAAVRAGVAARNGASAEEAAAWQAFLKYTPHRLRPWSHPIAIPEDARVFVAPAGLWIDDGARLWAMQPDGRVVVEAETEGRTLTAGPGYRVELRGGQLRWFEAGKLRWTLKRPFEPISGGRSASGYLAVWGPKGGAWIDPALGRVRARFRGQVIASGDKSLLVRHGGQVHLLRAGQEAPAWSRPAAEHGALTDERALLIDAASVRLIRTRNGQPVGEPIALDGRRLLHASRRHAVFGDAHHYQLVDILAAQSRAPARGPGRPVAAVTRLDGVAIAFEAGDVLAVAADGAIQTRVLLPRAPRALHLREDARLVVAIEAFGVHAIADLPPGENTDVDALLQLARLARDDGDVEAAGRLAAWAARVAAGPIGEVEALRSELAASPSAQAWSRARGEAAADLTKSLGRYRGLGFSNP